MHFTKAKFFGFGEVKVYIWKLFQHRNQKGLILSWYCTSIICIFVHVCVWNCMYNDIHLIWLIIWDIVLLTTLPTKYKLWLLVQIPMNSGIWVLTNIHQQKKLVQLSECGNACWDRFLFCRWDGLNITWTV